MSNEDKWMSCTSCHAVVQLNATGVCLGCQGGFGGQAEEDEYIPKIVKKAATKSKTRGKKNVSKK